MSNNEKQITNEVRGTKKYVRKFREIKPNMILDIEKYGIIPIGTDEIFVRIKDSNTHYISNYGRAVAVTGSAKILNGNYSKDKKLTYKIPVWKNGEKYYLTKRADGLVVETFHECEILDSNTYIWHSGDDVDDCYYRNLYPMSIKIYRAIKTFIKNGGFDTEEKILEIMNGDAYFIPTILNVGYWGMPDVDIHHWTYVTWVNMLMRCYSDAFHSRESSYIGCEVDEEWHNYARFKKWAEENLYQVDNEKMELDKDILVKGNKVYSSETCVFVPKSINSLIINAEANRGKFPVGVSFLNGKYIARMSYCGKQIEVASCDTPEEAFLAYKEYKEKFIKDIANRYKDKIPEKLYQAMIHWKIEITD